MTVTITGIDVSSYQGHIDWHAAHGSAAFAILKASEGVTYADPTFAPNRFGAVQAGCRVGAYHFARSNDPVAEAEHFLKVVGKVNPGDLPPTYDCESGGGNLVGQALAWLQHVEHATGRIPFLYSYKPFITAHLAGDTRLAHYPLWIAAYGSAPPNVAGWPTWTIWQRTSSGTIPGIAGRVDVDVFNGDQTAFDIVCGIHQDTQWPTLGAFSTDAAIGKPLVSYWQQLLVSEAAQHEVTVNGRFDGATVAATKNFQTIAHLPSTGIVDSATRAAILALTK